MKNLLFITAVLLSFLIISCDTPAKKSLSTKSITTTQVIVPVKKEVKPIQKVETLKQGEYLSSVDTSKIHTFADYDYVKMSLWREYDAAKMKAWRKYNSDKMTAWKIYWAKKDSAIKVIRESHYELYMSWLDAKQIDDYKKVRQIEEKPEFSPLNIAEKWYDIYTKADNAGYVLYQKIDNEAYVEYDRKENYAYRIFDMRKK